MSEPNMQEVDAHVADLVDQLNTIEWMTMTAPTLKAHRMEVLTLIAFMEERLRRLNALVVEAQ